MTHPLLSASAVRRSGQHFLALARADQLAHWRVDDTALPAAVAETVAAIRAAYPDLAIPYHARWRHFSAGGQDRWAELAKSLPTPAEHLCVAIELVITAVLLDAGAGPDWQWREPDGQTFGRSEGLGLAALATYRAGTFSAVPGQPWRVDAAALERLDAATLGHAMQSRGDNPLLGLPGRVTMLQRLGAAITARPDRFPTGRLGAFATLLAGAGAVRAEEILQHLLVTFGAVWPSGQRQGDTDLGDAWPHCQALENGYVPFHKLSQWLAYSLLEPLEAAGVQVSGLDGLTGLPEYRNGGLFIDTGVLVPRDPALPQQRLAVSHAAVIEWRALTVGLLDQLHPHVAAALGLDLAAFPLARLLEGGTWAAGRRIAKRQRADGGPPLTLVLDGTVF